MNAFLFAARSLVRQPARAALGIIGVAAVGALLFDMLLLSQGLLVSMRDLLDRTGWDVRVTANDEFPRRATQITNALDHVKRLSALPQVRAALALRFVEGQIVMGDSPAVDISFQGAAGAATRPWTVLRGRDASGSEEIVIGESTAATMGVQPGGSLTLTASCDPENAALPPVRFRVTGIAEFPFELTTENSVAGTLDALSRACGGNREDEAEVILVRSSGDANAAAAAIRRGEAGLRATTNEEMIGRVQETGFTYFRQISIVLTTVTLSFALLLIAVLLTVSVNQRLGEIAALRALGFSRTRVVADVLSESALIVGTGGLLSLPLGLLLASGLDRILQQMPGIPAQLHFFVFEPSALVTHVVLLAATAILAALYPMRIVSRLPIAATLRAETIG